MASLSTPAHMSAVAPPGRRERALMRSGEMPVVSSTSLAEWRRALVILLDLISYQRLSKVLKWWLMGVSLRAAASVTCEQMCIVMRARALAGHTSGSLVAQCPTFSPRTAFFWSENSREANVIRSRSFSSCKGASAAL